MINTNNFNYEIDIEDSGNRLDIFLSNLLVDFSRSRIQKLINDEQILVNGTPLKNSYKLKCQDLISLNLPELKPLEVKPENIPLEFVYEDDDLAVINKPSGMLTHPAPGKYTGTLVNALLYHCKDSLSGINGFLRPGIVHRLDKDTTGLIVIAKNDVTHQHLTKQFQERTINKYYIAIVQGNFKEDTGIIDAPIDRHPKYRDKMAVVEGGKEAITHWKILERFYEATLLEAKILTGRTHQLRVHFSHINHPILGDPTYSKLKNQKIKLNRQALQAYKMSFIHPKSGNLINFQIEYDNMILRVLNILSIKNPPGG